jgi:YegS/Rv2252/BmrU family lipid kinase
MQETHTTSLFRDAHKTLLLGNPQAANGAVGRHWQKHLRAVSAWFGAATVRLTERPGHATLLVRDGLEHGCERVVVVGGDGTLNEAVNGFFTPDGAPLGSKAVLAYYPAGTGGDFARSIGLSDPSTADLLATASPRTIDLGRATLQSADGREVRRIFINISSFGMSGVIDNKVNETTKVLGGKASFMLGTLKALATYRAPSVRLRVEGGPSPFDQTLKVNTVAVANGRYFGGSMMIAPNALVDDGLFDVVAVAATSTGHFLANSPKVYRGTHLSLPNVTFVRGKEIVAEPTTGPVLIDIDGEQPGRLPVRYEIMPKAITVWAPWRYAEGVAGE